MFALFQKEKQKEGDGAANIDLTGVSKMSSY